MNFYQTKRGLTLVGVLCTFLLEPGSFPQTLASQSILGFRNCAYIDGPVQTVMQGWGIKIILTQSIQFLLILNIQHVFRAMMFLLSWNHFWYLYDVAGPWMMHAHILQSCKGFLIETPRCLAPRTGKGGGKKWQPVTVLTFWSEWSTANVH